MEFVIYARKGRKEGVMKVRNGREEKRGRKRCKG